jgi:L-ascorbate metabolism protein UlaG (beta-lactamase superfamily)
MKKVRSAILSAVYPSVFALAFVLGAGSEPGWSKGNLVTITPLGAQAGEFCVGDRALLFEDPTGVRVLTAPGRTVRGSTDPRIAPLGSIHVILIDHPHVDHIGDVFHNNCAGTSTSPVPFPSEGNAPEIAAKQNSAVIVGGEMNSFFTQKILNINGTAPPGCPNSGLDNTFTVPRTSPCIGGIRGGTLTASMGGQPGVKFTTIPAWHSAGVARAEIDAPNVPLGLTGYAGSESGFIIRFTNGLTVLWTGDSGLIGDWATQSAFYQPNLAVVHADGLFVMGPNEAAWAVNNLIKPNMVIPEHLNQVSTIGGEVVSGSRLESFIGQVKHGTVIVPLSGIPISCDGKAHCRQEK